MRINRCCGVLALLGILGLATIGCTGTPPAGQASVTCRHAECPCCVRNGDLACIDVAIEPTTPSWEYEGTTYYFCSEDCLDAFVKDPSRYVQR